MRKSNDLIPSAACVKRRELPMSSSSDYATLSVAVRQVCLRAIQRDVQPADVRTALEEELEARNYRWENNSQKERALNAYEKYICRFARAEARPIRIPDGTETVNVFGEDILVLPDFYVVHGDSVEVAKIKISAPKSKSCDDDSKELYAFCQWARKAYPNAATVKASYYYLKDATDRGKDIGKYTNYYDADATDKVHTMLYEPQRDKFFAEEFDKLYHPQEACSADDCAACPQNNLCHYLAARIPSELPKEVKPMSEIYLTNSQEQAIDFDKGIARINAGAGAGKTLVVAMRIVSLLSKGFAPEDICLLTFTNSGAMEMTERVKRYCEDLGIPADVEKITSTTFNAFCQGILDEHYADLGYFAPPTVVDDETKCGIIKDVLNKYPEIEGWDYLNFTMNEFRAKGALWKAVEAFSQIKKHGYTKLNNPFELSDGATGILFQAYDDFNRTMRARGLIDYDDQIQLTFRLILQDPALFDKMGYKHIIVDEFQDTDLSQIKLLKEMIDTPSFESFMAVGDDSQAIFSFRDTSPEYLINFFSYFPSSGPQADFYLLENHRSQKKIIDMANKINALNKHRVEKDLVATKAPAMDPWARGFYGQDEEYEWIRDEIVKKVNGEPEGKNPDGSVKEAVPGRNPSTICFIASTRYELEKMSDLLTKAGIPCVMMNPEPYMENSKVKAVLSFAASFSNGAEAGMLDLLNVKFGGTLLDCTDAQITKTLEDFKKLLASVPKTKETFFALIEQLDPDGKDELYQAFLDKLRNKRTMQDLSEYLRDFSLYGQKTMYKKEAKYDGVVLTTAHSSKGLEWDTVYCSLTKFDDASMHQRSKLEAVEEKRRLLFVTLTRAREELYVTGDYTAYSSTKEGRVYNQFLRDCYNALGRTFAPDPNQYFIREKKKKAENRAKRARAKGLDLDDLKKPSSPAVKKLLEEYGKACPGKDFCKEHGIPAMEFLDTDDIKEYTEMYAKPNALAEYRDWLAKGGHEYVPASKLEEPAYQSSGIRTIMRLDGFFRTANEREGIAMRRAIGVGDDTKTARAVTDAGRYNLDFDALLKKFREKLKDVPEMSLEQGDDAQGKEAC